ncbi:hypothetical protein [Paludisphaera borealis]|uniref:Uncharacterized protein n=1 Tax=Paludisphaera borealis TaxID=1387353 RepID=A0A1U7CQ13_9BACT|nr:hypothetical protein [Paludisphaera borealis]APW61017.1 hypothetical protein BSF38_02520 [Paludisphaera borealis]MDR3620263.1 hypothetical protein [Paludisphaera borealis]
MSRPAAAPPSRLPLVLLGLMTLISFGGPFLIAVILWGGPQSGWPPDRPVEWVGVGLVLVLFAACFTACVTIGWWHVRPAPTTAAGDEPKHDR